MTWPLIIVFLNPKCVVSVGAAEGGKKSCGSCFWNMSHKVHVVSASKDQNSVSVWSKKRFIDWEDTNREDGRRNDIHLARCMRLRGWGNRCAKVLVEQVLIGGPWKLAFMVKVCQHNWDNGSLVSESRLIFKFQLCPGPLVPWVGETLVLGAGGKISLLSAYPGCMTCGLGLLFLKSNSVSHQTG